MNVTDTEQKEEEGNLLLDVNVIVRVSRSQFIVPGEYYYVIEANGQRPFN